MIVYLPRLIKEINHLFYAGVEVVEFARSLLGRPVCNGLPASGCGRRRRRLVLLKVK